PSQIVKSDILSLSEKSRKEQFNVLCCIGIDILAGYQIGLSALAAGCCIKIFDPVQIGLIIARHEPTAIVVSPLHLEYVINSISPLSVAQDNLEIIVVGGRLPVELERKTKEKLSKKIYTLYGTEEAGIIAVKKYDHHSEHKSAGVIPPFLVGR
ncbi:AMP-binding protein, partial [Acetobacter tropicalis]